MAIKFTKKLLKNIQLNIFKTCVDTNISEWVDAIISFEENLWRFDFTFAAKDAIASSKNMFAAIAAR